MVNKQTCACLVLLIIHVKVCYNISITGVIDTRHPDRMILLPHMKKENDLRTEGVFERFIRRLLELLTTSFPEGQLPKYCRTLSRHVLKLKYRYAQKLGKHLKYMSQMYPEDVKRELLYYKKTLDERRPNRTAFLEAINTAFTLQQYMLFDDYVHELKNYGTKDKLYIDEDTEKLLQIILGRIHKLTARDSKDLEKKLRYAVKEYGNDLEAA